MKVALFSFLLLMGTSLTSIAQNKDTIFQKEWLEIDTLIVTKDMVKTALDKTNILYQKAKQRNLPDHVIKSLLYLYSFQERITEMNPTQLLKTIEAEILQMKDDAGKAVLYSLVAKLYRQYYYEQQWNLYSRKNTTEINKSDITTWNADDFKAVITKNFLRSLENSQLLQQKKIETYDALIIPGNSRNMRPTLFDLLANEALDFFKSGEIYTTRPVNTYIINDPNTLGTIHTFIRSDFSTKDSSSPKWQALRLYQQLIAFHQDDTKKDALLDINTDRIEWVNMYAHFAGKETAYQGALEEIINQYGTEPLAAQAWYLLAKEQSDKAAGYQPFGDTSNRYGYTKAMQMADKALSLYTIKNKGTANLANLLTEIKRKELRTQTEKVNIPHKPFRTLVSYRNIETLYNKIIRVDDNETLRNEREEKAFWKKLVTIKSYANFTQPLPGTNDAQLHSAEIKIQGLPVGEYALLSSDTQSFDDSLSKLSVQFFHVSNISYIKNNNDYFVLNRETGKPLADVKVLIIRQLYVNKLQKNIDDTIITRTSNKNGYFKFDPVGYSNYRFVFTSATDKLNLKEYEYLYSQNNIDATNEIIAANYETTNSRVFFFTDRSIYRPGQTIFFKGIAVTKDYTTKLSKIINSKDSAWVYLIDANRKIIDSLKFGLNNYGSFNGKFILPQNILTGNFRIEARKYNVSSANFSVEEYKRPTFQVSFEKVKGAYRLTDSVTVTGIAKAFSGSNIDGAKLVYRVARNMRFLDPWTSRRPYPTEGNREISYGEIKTDSEGKFSIQFKALADDITDSSNNPVFDFSVSADITDINGETRSSNTTITVGYASLLLNVSVPTITEIDSLKEVRVFSTNLSSEKEPALVKVKIYSLVAPSQPIRKRFWARPDQFVMSKKEFAGYFPSDEYEEESNYQNWETGQLVLETTIDTKEKNVFEIENGLLKSGYYKIEAFATDKYGKLAKTVQYVQLFSRSKEEAPAPAYQFNYTINGIAKPGQSASFISGTMAEHIFMIRKTERPFNKSTGYQFIEKNKGFETINFTPEESDRGSVIISEAFVYDNRIYTYQYYINVPWNNKQLQVQYSSYRNKTEPGSNEKWTVSVLGDKNEKAAAELLTGMYDASLDRLKPHSWYVPSIWNANTISSPFIATSSFSSSQSRENYLYTSYITPESMVADRLAVSGFELCDRDFSKWLSDSVHLGLHESATIRYTKQIRIKDFARKEISNSPMNLSTGNLIVAGQFSGQLSTKVSVDGKRYFGDETISIRGANSMATPNVSLYIVDGKIATSITDIDVNSIESVNILKATEATSLYGPAGVNGAIVITTKGKTSTPVQPRKNFNETAFFSPQLYADSTGKYSFSFTMPEALTQWKWMSLAHTKDLAFGTNSANIITQKKMMVQANAPRFMREGDNMEFSAKIANLTDKEITGQVTLELLDAATNTPVDGWFQNIFPAQYFTVGAGQSFPVKFPIQIPFSFNKPLTWRIIARAGEYSDGEENILPVLTNRMLVTESLPLFLQNDTTQHFSFDKLLHNTSESLTQEALTVEYTSNPVWYAVQALPYLMEYPYECAEQTFNRFYANALASYIVNKHPKIKQVFEKWKLDSSSLKSNLQKNEELKQVLLQETPWVMEAASEEQKKKNLSLLFDLVKLSSQTDALIEKLSQLQLPNGSFSWFKGGREDRYMTNYILTGIGKLKRLGAVTPEAASRIRVMLLNAVKYLDEKIAEDYNWIVKSKTDLNLQHISSTQIDYLYMRSFFRDIAQQSPKEYDYFFKQGKQFWIKQNSYYKAVLGLIYYRNNDEKFANTTILPALVENTVMDSKQGMYWKATYTQNWYQSPIEHQSMMIAFMSELNQDQKNPSILKNINAMKTWLLLNKQTNNWRTTIATADACYALLLNGNDWLNAEKKVTIQLGKTIINSSDEKTEAATGYFKKRIEGGKVNPDMANITVSTKSGTTGSTPAASQSPSWGTVYWQYFEDLDKITPSASPLSLVKKLFVEKNSDKGKILEPIAEGAELKTGDKIVVRIELRSDRDMDYLHLKDMRAAAMEPVNVLSGYKWQDGLGYYESTKDASTNFFIDHLRRGTYVFDYPLFITHTGVFSVGIASIQCMYAPEFTSHSEGIKIRVAK